MARLATCAAVLLAACSSSVETEPPPITRETVPPVTRPTPAPTSTAVEPPTSDSVVTTTTEPPPLLLAEIDFESFGDSIDAGFLTVPLDYSDPTGATIDLWVVRHRADPDDRVGVMLANNGGPGVPASGIAANVDSWFDDPIVDRFDVVSWDPRGTGRSGGSVDCIDDDEYDRFFGTADITPETQAERDLLVELSREFAEACVEEVGEDVLPHLGTNNSARDMDSIRRALGEPQISYLGFSYGSELGAVWATLFPDTVRSAVLDGAAHPDADGLEPLRQQQLGFEGVFETFLEQCSADSSCLFHNDGDAAGAYDELLARLDEEPASSPDGRPDVGQRIAINGVIQAMYSDQRWPALERALVDAAAGDGAGLLAFHDSYFQRDPSTGSYSNLLESFQAITCADDPERLTVAEADRRAAELVGIAPRLFPFTTADYTCDFFPPSADPRMEITGDRAGPIVVIGTTGDPTTPLTSSAAMADALEAGQLVTVEANQHTAYRTNECVRDLVHEYLIWLEPPALDARC
ncbi:MAG: alpha/beta fold hydrolase [Ilumatobacter sp.]